MFALGITDLRWHARLLEAPPLDVANFWTPTPWSVRLPPGARWFFMLKHPVRRIGGFGTLLRYEECTVSEAWARYGPGNGVESGMELLERVAAYAEKRAARARAADPTIGCVILGDCVFAPPALQIAPQALGLSFPRQIVKFKTFADELRLPFEDELPDARAPFVLVPPTDGETELRKAKKRIAQPQFRARVLDAYEDTCAFTRTQCREALEAAHIQPFLSLASNHVQNGLALRRDVHALFDAGLLGVTSSGRIMVGAALAGTEYAALADRDVRLPSRAGDHPSEAALALHRTMVFRSGR